jgi:hypothetical protein
MKLKITITMENSAFDDDCGGGAESARILRDLADRIDGGLSDKTRVVLVDINGNRVGEAKVMR